MSKTEPNWCGTCQLLELAANEIDQMSPAKKAELRNNIRRQFALPESDQDFLKSIGIDPDA